MKMTVYVLRILTGNDFPNGEMDGIVLCFETIEEAFSIAKIAIKQEYKVEIYEDKEK
jgi:hypothetical protein